MIIKNISLMNILNKSGPRIKPCGTNLATNSSCEIQSQAFDKSIKIVLTNHNPILSAMIGEV